MTMEPTVQGLIVGAAAALAGVFAGFFIAVLAYLAGRRRRRAYEPGDDN